MTPTYKHRFLLHSLQHLRKEGAAARRQARYVSAISDRSVHRSRFSARNPHLLTLLTGILTVLIITMGIPSTGFCAGRIIGVGAESVPSPAPAPSASATPMTIPDAELFDVKMEQVIRLIPVTDSLRQEAIRWLDAGSGKAGELAFEPHSGIGLRIALIPPVQVNKPWYQGQVRELFLFAESTGGPHRLLFIDDQSRMHLIVLPYDLTKFLADNRIDIPK
ncbi:hypothetical protein [Gorillibacterium timonense]|uniref:hypothetical protein n=1 Tax=Gorillibacterium timonense TaxID=1689269 RepID=UPI00071E36BB|nr:hypothetical protein [Gorillibacterium timonense]